jgi:hypothetical protein
MSRLTGCATEVWELYNTTGDAHPMHIHEITFEVVNREGLVLNDDGEVVQPIQLDGNVTLPEPRESGFKDTVIAYPGQVTRLRAVQHAGTVRVALPHRRARGQRDDAAVSDRSTAARPAQVSPSGSSSQRELPANGHSSEDGHPRS